MKRSYINPSLQVIDLPREDVLTSSPLGVKGKNDPMDNCGWSDIINGSRA